jgi:RNA polymerase sigma factor (sigma-70 family)
VAHDFIQSYEDHVWEVYGYLAYRVGSRVDAEDLTQATFERAFRAWERFDQRKASVRTWFLAIARNALIDHQRRRRSLGPVSSLEGQSEANLPTRSGPEETNLGLTPELESALRSLTPREREALALRFGGDLKGAEIAVLMDLSVANVHQILSRGLRKLHDELAAHERPPVRLREGSVSRAD